MVTNTAAVRAGARTNGDMTILEHIEPDSKANKDTYVVLYYDQMYTRVYDLDSLKLTWYIRNLLPVTLNSNLYNSLENAFQVIQTPAT